MSIPVVKESTATDQGVYKEGFGSLNCTRNRLRKLDGLVNNRRYSDIETACDDETNINDDICEQFFWITAER